MAKVRELVENHSTIKVHPLNMDGIDQEKLWVHYDPEADSMVIYITGAPERATSVHVDEKTYLKVNRTTGNIVGFHIEAWEQRFVPSHPELQSIWTKLKPWSEPEPERNYLLRMLALWTIFVYKSDHIINSILEPA